MNNRVCNLLGIQYPILQGPMAWASTAPLVGAVSNAGGLGVLGVGFAPPDFIREQIRQTRAVTDRPFAINLCIEHGNGVLDEVSELAIAEAVPVVYADTIIHLDEALCRRYFALWHAHGIKIIVKASILDDAIIAERAGADLIVVKGWEAGGHVPYEATTVITPLAADHVSCPVIAAGGICDGRGVAAAFALGAEGVEMGSVFLMTEECGVHPNVKRAILAAGDMSTVITGSPTGEPCRQLANAFSDRVLEIEYGHTREEAAPLLRTLCASSLKKAMAEGDLTDGAVMVGQNAALLREIRPAGAVIASVWSQAARVLDRMDAALRAGER